ncbi:hypothetical protein Hte_005253 [Hypoxylon texense]
MRSQAIIAAAAGLLLSTPTAVVAQDTADATSCQLAMRTLVAEMPQPTDAALASWAGSWAFAHQGTPGPTDPCAAAAALPASLTGAAASYESQVRSFARARATEIAAAESACAAALASGGFPGMDPSAVASDLQALTRYGGPAGTTCVLGGTGSPNAAVAKPTGGVAVAGAAAAAAAGMLGAAAIL